MASICLATFNASLNRNSAGELIADLSGPDDEQAKAIAQIIQIVNPDVLLINEFDFDADGIDARGVIVGDQNADPFDGDSFDNAIAQLLDNPRVNDSRSLSV